MKLANTTKASLGQPRFKLYSFSEMSHYARHPGEWDATCRRDGVDTKESPEDEAVREMTKLRLRQL
jgi:hypothetical protein